MVVDQCFSHNRLRAEPAIFIGAGLAKNENLQTISVRMNR